VIDAAGYLVLWQVGVVGDRSLARFPTGSPYRQLLVEILCEDYPPDHPVILYRAATLPIEQPRVRRLRLGELTAVTISGEDTLVLPPIGAPKPNMTMRARLAALDEQYDDTTSA
jgi:hypothetical protein